MKADTKLLRARTEDLFTLCEKRGEAVFSPFLDGGEIAFIEDEFHMPYGFNTMIFGGYEGAERAVLGVFPEWREERGEDFPICALRFDAPRFRTLTHRDYLGTVMSLGIDRNKTGDILTDDEGAYVLLDEAIAEYVVRNVNKIANVGVKGKIIGIEDFTPPKPKTKEKMCVCASKRLDAVMAAALNISRSAAEKLIREGLVKINHRAVTDRSKTVNIGDLLSVRNYGRFILKDTGNNTGKGRLHITVEKFV